MSLSIVDREYLKVVKRELATAIRNGEPERAASFARALARLIRKDKSQAQDHYKGAQACNP